MTKSATELLMEKKPRQFSIGAVLSDSLTVFFDNFVPITLALIAADALCILVNLSGAISAIVSEFRGNYSYNNGDTISRLSTIFRATVFITEAFFYPIAALFIARIALAKLRGQGVGTKRDFEAGQFGVSLIAYTPAFIVYYLIFMGVVSFALTITQGNKGSLQLTLTMISATSQFVHIVLFASLFPIAVPITIDKGTGVSDTLSQNMTYLRGNRGKVLSILLISSMTVWVILWFVAKMYYLFPIRYVGLHYVLMFPIRDFLFAYTFTLPAVIYHHLAPVESEKKPHDGSGVSPELRASLAEMLRPK